MLNNNNLVFCTVNDDLEFVVGRTLDDVDVHGTTFVSNEDGTINEYMVPFFWKPDHPTGFQLDDGREIALTSYASFSREGAENWCRKAAVAYNAMFA